MELIDLTNFEYLIDFNYRYMINKQGEIYSCWYKKIMKPHLNETGYYCINLSNTDRKHKCFIHRLLAIQYIPNPDNLPEIDHINRVRTDNRLENLRWCDRYTNANNKSNCIALMSEEEQKKREDDIREYKRVWAENDRRAKGVPEKVFLKDLSEEELKEKELDKKEQIRIRAMERRSNMTDEQRAEYNERQRELYANKQKDEDFKNAAKERAKKQREEIKADPIKAEQLREYKRLKAKEYREKKKGII
jgi:hypothetical protein